MNAALTPPPRQRTMLSVEIDPPMKRELEEFRKAHEMRPSITWMVRRALREFLDRQAKGKTR